MKVLVIGARGQLGVDVCKVFADAELHTVNSDELNIADRDAVFRTITEEIVPEIVVNTAAFHNVPKCEEEPGTAYMVNARGAQNLGAACEQIGARVLHVSTDYVFGHGGTRPYTEKDLPAPLSTYGATKLAGEHLLAAECKEHLIIRSAGLYGTSPCRAKGGKNFVELMLHLAKERGQVKVVIDEFTSPTYTGVLAEQMRLMALKAEPGVYHVTCQGECSWNEFARTIFMLTATEVQLDEAKSADFPSVVKRPSYSVLENAHLKAQKLDIMPDWREGLKRYLDEKAAAAV